MNPRRFAFILSWALVLSVAQAALAASPSVGPPYPPPVAGQRVYDYAGVFAAATIAETERTIVAIEARTGAQIAVYTQLKPGATTDSTEADARDLMDQWGVGRKGIDDGLVVLWNLDETLKHGQVQLFAGPGFQAIVSDQRRQAIFDDDMLPLLREGNLDDAMLVAMRRLEQILIPPATDTVGDRRSGEPDRSWALGLVLVASLVSLAMCRPGRRGPRSPRGA